VGTPLICPAAVPDPGTAKDSAEDFYLLIREEPQPPGQQQQHNNLQSC